ncbi:hypothetical protein J2801_001938 [Paraburkholderia phenoliruptrix]|nr:hypothetical protein [Paraburkholderia phenoliruptrix]
MSGTLYLIPNTLGEGDADALGAVLPAPVRARAAALQYYIGENAKTTRAFLKKVGTERPIQEIEIRELNVNICRMRRSKPICSPKRPMTSQAARSPRDSALHCSKQFTPTIRRLSSVFR